MAENNLDVAGAAFMSTAAAESNDVLAAGMKEDWRLIAAAQARFVVRLAESNKREMFRDEGATSPEAWVAEYFGISVPTARSLSHVAEKVQDLPHLVGSLHEGDISFDKLRAVVDVATRETDRELCDQAKERSVRELVDVARSAADRARSASSSPSRSERDSRYLRFNDGHRTVSLQLPTEEFARTKACVDSWAATFASDEETRLDQRRCDGFMGIVQAATPGADHRAGEVSSDPATAPNPFFVVAHVPLEALVEESGETSELAGELEHHGLIDVETVRRIACDATVVVAVDDGAGHTMYEGRARRFPSGTQRREVIRRDRHCRFPGCTNATFVIVHHIVPWKPGGGTDLPNLVLLCRHHHGVVHRKGWSLSGNANEELSIRVPAGRVMVSRPSPLWTRVTAGRRSAGSG
jgi:nicotinamide riboside kinase